MSEFEFYEIKSRKARQFENGVRKVSLVCSGKPDAHFFLWYDQQEQLKHLQFLFNEKLVEWFDSNKSLITSRTNRGLIGENTRPGIHKGVRTIHTVKDDTIQQEAKTIAANAIFPKKYAKTIQSVLGVNEIPPTVN